MEREARAHVAAASERLLRGVQEPVVARERGSAWSSASIAPHPIGVIIPVRLRKHPGLPVPRPGAEGAE